MAAFLAAISHPYLGVALSIVGVVVFFRIFRRPIRKMQKIIFAAFMNFAAKRYNYKMNKRKEQLFLEMQTLSSQLRRPLDILEVGAGSGANFKYYPKGTNVMCIDPNPYFDRYLKSNSEQFPHVNLREMLVCRAEDMSTLLNSSVDAVVCTLVLCSVDDVAQSLQEIKRVLRPGGRFFFLEHVAADRNTTLNRVQAFLTPIWRIIGDGCHLNRETWKLVDDAGFSSVNAERFSVQSKSIFGRIVIPPVLRPHCSGIAIK